MGARYKEWVRIGHCQWRAFRLPKARAPWTVAPDAYDDEDIVNYFSGTTWRGHDAVKLRHHSAAFSFLTPKAFHYWLPAFLIAAINDAHEADVILEYIPRSITDSYASKRWPLFSEKQRDAVAAYLQFSIARLPEYAVEDERKALDALRMNRTR